MKRGKNIRRKRQREKGSSHHSPYYM
uniref:Uncharacterized protein n=1 Tax=Rhizophora mucronata TaxID=61149 RepID=A0A2P2NB91_RHIMU